MKVSDFKQETQKVAGVFGRDSKVRVIFEGKEAYTDGQEIVLPSLDEGSVVNDELVPVMRGYLDHEAGHIRHTDFPTFKKWREKASDAWGHLHNCLEDIWLEARVMKEYPGAERNLSSLTEFINKEEIKSFKEHPEVMKDINVHSVCGGILQEGRKNYPGLTHSEEYESFLPEKVKKWKGKWIEEVHKCKNTGEVINLTKEIAKLLKEDPELESTPESWKPDLSGDPTDAGDTASDGEPMKGFTKDEAKKWKDPTTYAIDELGGSGLTKDKSPEGKNKSSYRILTDRFDEVYSKKKGSTSSYKRNKLIEKATKSDYDSQVSELQSHVNVMRSKLRRAIAAKDRRDWDYARETGRLDSKKLVAAYQRTPTVFKTRKDKEEINTAIHILIDLSGSMSGVKMQMAAQTAIALNECLAGSTVKYQISGFSNMLPQDSKSYRHLSKLEEKWRGNCHRYEPMVITKYKVWDESLFEAKEAMSTLHKAAGGNNADTCAVDWAYQDLKKQEAMRKILIVLSDGSPACYTLGMADIHTPLVEKVSEIMSTGTEVIGIGIMTSSVAQFFPNHTVVHNLEDLSGTMFNQLSQILVGGKLKL